MFYREFLLALSLSLAATLSPAQVIDFESGGLHYKTLTKDGLTVMFAHLPGHVLSYSILQIAISNGSPAPCSLRPEDFVYLRPDGAGLRALNEYAVVNSLMDKAGRGDVIKLITTYEGGLYGNPNFKSTNGYESRRQDALAAFGSAKLKAAAAASAIVFVKTRLKPGESTDGAIFFLNNGKPLINGRLTVHLPGRTFTFDDPLPPAK